MAFLKPDAPAPATPVATPPPPPTSAPQGKKPGNKNQTTTFLGADASPGPASGVGAGKTLLGE